MRGAGATREDCRRKSQEDELVNYVRILYRHQPKWMSDRVSVVGDNVGQLTLSNGSEVIGIPAGEEQIRSYHLTGVVFDEMSHLPAAKQAYAIAHPVARQIVGISSVAPGFFAVECGL
jgi:hypothetical protein